MSSDKRTIVPKIVAGRRAFELLHLLLILLLGLALPLGALGACQVVACRSTNPTWSTLKCLAPHADREG